MKRKDLARTPTLIDETPTKKRRLADVDSFAVQTVISAHQYERVKAGSLSLHTTKDGKRYVRISINNQQMYLSHFVGGKPQPGMVKDHINGNELDNTDENLRDATPSQNTQNRSKAPGKSSIYIGVSWHQLAKKWNMVIRNPASKIHYRRLYTDQEVAARTYDTFAICFYGLHARTNGFLSQAQKKMIAKHPEAHLPFSPRVKSLPLGVKKNKKKFMATFGVDGKRQYLGLYGTIGEAAEAVERAKLLKAQRLEESSRNEPILRNGNGCAIIRLNTTSRSRFPCYEIQVDDQHWHALNKTHWHWNGKSNTYPSGHVNGKPVRFHIFVWRLTHPDQDIPPGHQIDHIQSNKLDCREQSLRCVTRAANNQNKKKRTGCTSQYLGVSWSTTGRYWIAQISVNGTHVPLGSFQQEYDAALAYNEAVSIYYPGGSLNGVSPRSTAVAGSRKRVLVTTSINKSARSRIS